MTSLKTDFENTVELICKVLQIAWKVKIVWQNDQNERTSHMCTMEPNTKSFSLLCNESWLKNDDKAIELFRAVTERLAEIALYDMQAAVDAQKKVLQNIVRGIVEQNMSDAHS